MNKKMCIVILIFHVYRQSSSYYPSESGMPDKGDASNITASVIQLEIATTLSTSMGLAVDAEEKDTSIRLVQTGKFNKEHRV